MTSERIQELYDKIANASKEGSTIPASELEPYLDPLATAYFNLKTIEKTPTEAL